MTAAERHRELDDRLMQGRRDGTLTEIEDEKLCEEMDDCWWKMTEEERRAETRRVARETRQP
jgi:hypothetical protein